MILCVGEILADLIGKTENGSLAYDRRAGGAPFNVACGVRKFGAESAFVGSVGDDLVGRFLYSFAKAHVNRVHIRVDGRRNTTLAFVELDREGDRSFCFYRKNTADVFLPAVPKRLLQRAKIVHIGSLMLSEKRGIEYAENLAKTAHGVGKLVSFDVNYREDIFPDREKAAGLYRRMLEAADVVKLSEEEYETFGRGYVAEALREKLVCVTLGAKGCMWRYRGEENTLPTLPLKPVDTTGAGDAFYAGVLFKLDALDRDMWTRETLDGVFAFANACGALTTQARGAIDALPALSEIEAALRG